MPSRTPPFSRSVFINCPFDRQYWPLFEAITSCILHCGLSPRCALEAADSGEARLSRIRRIIAACQLGIHDLSRVEAGGTSGLPRFNTPFELGLDFGAKEFGPARLRRKKLLVLNAIPYRYQASLSDFAGQDIRTHENSPAIALRVVRDWLRTELAGRRIPGPEIMKQGFRDFSADLPGLCKTAGLDRDDMQFVEYVELATTWLRSPGSLQGS